jgi:hypothetical protein
LRIRLSRMKGKIVNNKITQQLSLRIWRQKAVWLALIPAAAILSLALIPVALSDETTMPIPEARI